MTCARDTCHPADVKSLRNPIPCKSGDGADRALPSDVFADPLTMSFVLAGLAAVQVLGAALLKWGGK
jgi:hypothetical protein